ncbi:MAG: hypothetical protein U0930_04785 [Pirellulales bacterium]
MKKLDATCVLLNSSREPASEELQSVVTLHEVEGPLNTYWFGIAEVATSFATCLKWTRDNPFEVFLSIHFADGRRGEGRWLASKVEHDSQSDAVQISFFVITLLAAD